MPTTSHGVQLQGEVTRPSPLLIRADASEGIGTGHVMRMIALAQAWQERGGEATIAACMCPRGLVGRLQEELISFADLGELSPGGSADVAATAKLASTLKSEWVVLDGYRFDSSYQASLRGRALKVLAVDDYGHCDQWNANLVLNQNLYAPALDYQRAGGDAEFLLGPKYVLLRREFRAHDRSPERAGADASKLLVTLGGADPANITEIVLGLINGFTDYRLDVKLLIGAANENAGQLQESADTSQHNVEILQDVRNMPQLLEWADGIVSAGGSTCWEWMYFGLRAAVIVMADNQNLVSKALAEEKYAVILGDGREPELLKTQQRAFRDFILSGEGGYPRSDIDGYGAARTAAYFDNKVWLRPAESRDSKTFFEWVNDPAVRENSFQQSKVEWETHDSWFQEKCVSKDSHLFVVFFENEKCGQVRFDRQKDGSLLIDFSVAPSFRRKGIGRSMMELALNHQSWRSPCTFVARVKPENRPSSAIFQKLGFRQIECPSTSFLEFHLNMRSSASPVLA